MIELILDGRRVQARKGEFLLSVAKRAGIPIPTLCHHEAVEPAGACRLCMVEVTRPEWKDWSKLVTACLFPAEDGLVVNTRSTRVTDLRREVLELLLARSPKATELIRLGREYGIEETGYSVEADGDNCILCDICTRVCNHLVTGAISRVNRGIEKKVETPFGEPSNDCIGCLACAKSCPTQAIPFKQEGNHRTIWGKTFELVACKQCGAPTVTREQAEWIAGRTGKPLDEYFLCESCKMKNTAQSSRKLAW